MQWRNQEACYCDIHTLAEAAQGSRQAFAAKALAEKAGLQAATTAESLRIARDTEQRQLRAYLTITESSVTVDAANMPAIIIKFKKSGLTPAYAVSLRTCAVIDQFIFNDGNFFIPRDLPQPYAKINWKSWPNRGTAAIYVYGRMNYKDAFGFPRYVNYRFLTNDRVGMTAGTTVNTDVGNESE